MKLLLKASFVIILCALIGCSKDPDYSNFDGFLTYKITPLNNQFIADDSSRMVVHINAAGATNGDYITIGFPAAGGTILGADASNKVYLVNDTASFIIQASQAPGTYQLTTQFNANVQSFRTQNVVSKTSYPDVLAVDASQSYLDITASLTLTVILQKKKGLVSQGVTIGGSAYQMVGGSPVPVGRFTGLTGNKSDATSKIALTFFCDTRNFDLTLPVYFKFTSNNDAGARIQTIYTMTFK